MPHGMVTRLGQRPTTRCGCPALGAESGYTNRQRVVNSPFLQVGMERIPAWLVNVENGVSVDGEGQCCRICNFLQTRPGHAFPVPRHHTVQASAVNPSAGV